LIVPRGTHADEVKACIKSSYLWHLINKLCLTRDVRVQINGQMAAGNITDILLKIVGEEFHTFEGQISVAHHLG